jgi:hypothetical protein
MYLAFRTMSVGMPRPLQMFSIDPMRRDWCDSAGHGKDGDSADAGVLARVPFENTGLLAKFISEGLPIPNSSKFPELPVLIGGDGSGVKDE